jgi:aminoglycoside phosphotransferase (APT) family kinase protein
MSEISSELVNVEALQRFLDAELPGSGGSLEIEQHVAGFSNVTLFVTRADQRWVLRRPPAGPLLPSAHDVLREYRFISALHGHARVPRPVLACEDDSIIGAPFYLMERVDGAVARDRIPPQYDTPGGRRRMAEEMVDALVELHAVDWQAVGLRGRPSGYLQRQLDLWTRQWELTRPHTRDLPGIDEVLRWLGASVPESAETTVVHGDYKLDNVIFAGDEPRLAAIFDWEMATVGDPLADLGWFLAYWGDPADPAVEKDGRVLATDLSRHLTQNGFPDRAELARRYADRSGRSIGDLKFYLVLSAAKLCIILEGLYRRFLEGSASNPDSADFEWGVPLLVDRLQRLAAEPA